MSIVSLRQRIRPTLWIYLFHDDFNLLTYNCQTNLTRKRYLYRLHFFSQFIPYIIPKRAFNCTTQYLNINIGTIFPIETSRNNDTVVVHWDAQSHIPLLAQSPEQQATANWKVRRVLALYSRTRSWAADQAIAVNDATIPDNNTNIIPKHYF